MWETLHLKEVETLNQNLRISIQKERADPKDTAFSSSSDAIKNIYVNWYHNPDSWEKKLLSVLPSAYRCLTPTNTYHQCKCLKIQLSFEASL